MKTTQNNTPEFDLSYLLEGIIPFFTKTNASISIPDLKIKGLSTDSRHVQPGDLFIACKGSQADGRNYIENAIDHGAVAILAEAEAEAGADKYTYSVPVIKILKLTDYIGLIAARFYGEPSKYMTVVGFTGTNGKTSCTQFLAQALSRLNKTCGVIGTLGAGLLGNLQTTGLTTPGPLVLQSQLAFLRDKGAGIIAMEASSHGLLQGRMQGVVLNTAVWTNLTSDHLDYHGSMDNYALAKKQLFLQPSLQSAVFNLDDKYGRVLAEEFRNKLKVYGYTMEGIAIEGIGIISAKNNILTSEGFQSDITTPWGEGVLSSGLLGRFNISNMLAILTVLGIMQVPLKNALESLTSVKTVSGRMERFGGGKQPLVIVDYAHTPDALEKVLLTLRGYCHRKLWCVFGCGGNRDPSKRKLMGQIAEQYSDQIIITDDNPRFEDAQSITDDIIEGLLCPWAAEIEHDRAQAIAHAIQSAVPGDVILIAGKGHEDYQWIGHNRFAFNDAEQVLLQLSLKHSEGG